MYQGSTPPLTPYPIIIYPPDPHLMCRGCGPATHPAPLPPLPLPLISSPMHLGACPSCERIARSSPVHLSHVWHSSATLSGNLAGGLTPCYAVEQPRECSPSSLDWSCLFDMPPPSHGTVHKFRRLLAFGCSPFRSRPVPALPSTSFLHLRTRFCLGARMRANCAMCSVSLCTAPREVSSPSLLQASMHSSQGDQFPAPAYAAASFRIVSCWGPRIDIGGACPCACALGCGILAPTNVMCYTCPVRTLWG